MNRRVTILLSIGAAVLVWPACATKTPPALTLPNKPTLVAGFGTAPVSPVVASMWFASAPMPASGVRPAIMVYYRGPSGWLEKEVKHRADASGDPVFADFHVGDIRLFLQYWPAKQLVKLFDQEISVEVNNVIVATGLGVPGSPPVVRAVSVFRDVVPDGQNPGEYVLQHSVEAQKALE